MQGRSWMAALTLNASALLGLVLGLGHAVTSRADEAKPAPAPAPAPVNANGSRVKLEIIIAGLGPKGCDIEVAPGHMGCQFRPVSMHLGKENSQTVLLFDDVQTTGADRYCIFAITIREPGQPVKTVRRGMRLVASANDQSSAQLLTCYLSSPSKLAKASEMRERR